MNNHMIEKVRDALSKIPGIREVRYSGDVLVLVFENETVLTLFPADQGEVQGIIIDSKGEAQIFYNGH